MKLKLISFTALALGIRLVWVTAALSVLWLSIYLALR